MSLLSQALHGLIFSLDAGERLSSTMTTDRLTLFIAPIAGGAILGLVLFILAIYAKGRSSIRSKPMHCTVDGFL
jgi:chloride channel protein, CIC family